MIYDIICVYRRAWGFVYLRRLIIALIALVIAIPLALGAVAGLSYLTTTSSIIPHPHIQAMGISISPTGYNWREPILGGLIYRDFLEDVQNLPANLGVLAGESIPIAIPNGYTAKATITRENDTVFEGTQEELAQFQFIDNGTYQMQVECVQNSTEGMQSKGLLSYCFEFIVKVEPRMETSYSWVTQGDVLALRVLNLQEGQIPTAASSLGSPVFVPTGEGQMTAFVPVNHDVESGTFPVFVTMGSYEWQTDIRSIEASFPIVYEKEAGDEATPEEIEAFAAARNQLDSQFYETMAPIFDETDGTMYWEGVFTVPVQGTIANDYGMYTYTNTSSVPIRHTGIDIRAQYGADVTAPNGGRVVYVGTLNSTGNTVVVEHGGGLKSLFAHLSETFVQEGDMLAQGDVIGAVGSSGNASFSHLHYEVRLGHATLNPNLILGGTSNIYAFD